MNIKTIIAIFFFSIIASPVFAIDYPTIAGITVTENTTAADFVVYLFNLGIAVGAFIAVIMILMAGIEWLTSSGNPSKVESAKGKITNTLLGVCVLFGCYLILNTINSQLTTVKINDLACNHGVVVNVKLSDGRIDQECIDNSQSNITDEIISTARWNFPTDYILKVYAYSEVNYEGTITEIDCKGKACTGDITGAKSVYFLFNNPGIYLYDGNNLTPASPAVKSYPLFVSSSIPDLGEFAKFTKSLEIVNPSTNGNIKYQAVVFKDPKYSGRCAFVASSISDMDQAPSGLYTDNVGDNQISSIIVAKANLDQSVIHDNRGEVILYTKTNCGKAKVGTTEESIAGSEIKECHIPIGNASEGQQIILKYCSNFKAGDEVQSFAITGAAGLVLSTKNTASEGSSGGADYGGGTSYCKYFDKNDLKDGTCYSNVMNSDVYTVGGKTPKSFIVLPDN